MDNELTNNLSGDIESIFRKLYGPLCRYAYTFVLDETEAEDMVQDAFAAFIAKQGTAAEIKSPESYLYTTVKHRCLEYFRNLRIADRHMQKQAEALLFSFADDGNIDENDEIKMKVGAALAELSPQQRTVVELHILQGMRYQDIAKHLAISENSVRTHLKRAYRVLRSNLASILPFVFL